MSSSLQLHGLQHARPLCPSPSPGIYSDSCPLSWWCHPTISSSVIPCLLPPSIFPSIRAFPSELALRLRWPKHWSFSFSVSPSNEYSGLISFRMDWLDLFAIQGILESLLQHHSSKASILQCSSFLYSPTLTSIHLSLFSHEVVSNSCSPMEPARLLCPWDSPDNNTEVGCCFLLQGIFPNLGLLHCRQILYQLSYEGENHS